MQIVTEAEMKVPPSTPSPVSPRAKCQTDVSLSNVSSLHIFQSLPTFQ